MLGVRSNYGRLVRYGCIIAFAVNINIIIIISIFHSFS